MSQTNFLQFNPTATNQENDAAFAADSTRSGGIAFDQIMSSLLGNKALYQPSTMAAALAWMMVRKGYSPVDGTSPFTASGTPSAAVTNLAAVLANILTLEDIVPNKIVQTVGVVAKHQNSNASGTVLSATLTGALYRLSYALGITSTGTASVQLQVTYVDANGNNVVLSSANLSGASLLNRDQNSFMFWTETANPVTYTITLAGGTGLTYYCEAALELVSSQ
jgi:hypothetical protein